MQWAGLRLLVALLKFQTFDNLHSPARCVHSSLLHRHAALPDSRHHLCITHSDKFVELALKAMRRFPEDWVVEQAASLALIALYKFKPAGLVLPKVNLHVCGGLLEAL